MSPPKRGMGRGLDAILSVSGGGIEAAADELRELPVELIVANPKQPRRRFDDEALQALARFRDPALVIRTLDYAMSAKVKNQDAVRLVRIEMSDRRTRDLAWQWVQQNWPRVQAQITTWGGGTLVESTGNFCSAERSSQVTEFFREHTVLAASHALDRARDNITDCVDLRAAQGPNLKLWLQLS